MRNNFQITTTDLADAKSPLGPLTNYLAPWSLELMIIGGIVLGLCFMWAAVKMGARAASSKKGESGGIRDSIGMIVGVLLAGVFLGGGIFAVGLAMKIGKDAGEPISMSVPAVIHLSESVHGK